MSKREKREGKTERAETRRIKRRRREERLKRTLGGEENRESGRWGKREEERGKER